MGRLAATVLAGIALVLGLTACGGSDLPNAELRQAAVGKFLCEPPGWTIELHNSGVSCQAAGATVLLRADGMEGPQVIRERGGGEWVCRDVSGPGPSELLKCTQGKRFYTLKSR
jgi:hypothetical protein